MCHAMFLYKTMTIIRHFQNQPCVKDEDTVGCLNKTAIGEEQRLAC